MPVSTFFCFSLEYFPSAVLLYSMKTSFHISKYLPQLHPGPHVFEHGFLPVSMNISVHGPQGPVIPAGPQKLSLFPSQYILSPGMPRFCHILADSPSFGASPSPAKTVTCNCPGLNFSSFIKNSKLHSIASFFQ